MKKIKKILLIILILSIIGLLSFIVYEKFFNTEKENEVKVIKTIPGYGYNLDDNETVVYKEEFNNLEKILSSSEVNYEDYALSIAKLFIIDFYTLDNKLSKNDIGGVSYIHPLVKDNFIEEARSTFYKYLEVKTDKRTQKLPEVSNIIDEKIENTTFKIKSNNTTTNKNNKVTYETVDAYKVTISWEYKEDLGYESECKIIIIKKDNMLYIVEMD